jgi:malate synthase
VALDTGDVVTEELVRRVIDEEVASILTATGDIERLDDARRLFEQVALADEFPDFLTLPAYGLIE